MFCWSPRQHLINQELTDSGHQVLSERGVITKKEEEGIDGKVKFSGMGGEGQLECQLPGRGCVLVQCILSTRAVPDI